MLKKTKCRIDGIHCKSCKTLIETEIDLARGVSKVEVNHITGDCILEFDDRLISEKKLHKTIEKLGYGVKEAGEGGKSVTGRGFPKFAATAALAALLAVGYFYAKEYGLFEIMARLNEKRISYWIILIIGLLASFHCVGMCGGLVVAYSSKSSKFGEKNGGRLGASKPHMQYNFGRMISYSATGAILGGFGSFFGINPNFTGMVTLIAGFFMVLMGLSLLTNFSWLEKIKVKTPDSIARFLYNQRRNKKPKGPFVIGLFNGLMPCGPLQAMQLYALASGSALRGTISMAVYALGTVPLMFGFGSVISLISRKRIGKIMKFSGVAVIILGILMFNRGLTNFGYGFRELVSGKESGRVETGAENDSEEYQIAGMEVTYRGYSPNVLYVKKGIPVRWTIDVKQMSRCIDEIIMPEYGIRKKLEYGENVVEFIPKEAGEIKFSCWMQMVWGKFVVTDDGESPSPANSYQPPSEFPANSPSCGSSSCRGCGTPSCGCGVR